MTTVGSPQTHVGVLFLQFAGTLSDGLGKTMDHRHQSEREYIRYHGATSGEHLVAGIHGLAHGKSQCTGLGSAELLLSAVSIPFHQRLLNADQDRAT